MEKVQKIVLRNGLRLVLVPQKQSLATLVAVLVEAGSRYEKKEKNGVSHFLEHMCFKGTAARPRPADIAKDLDSLGAQYNAFTSQEHTSYYVKVRNEAAEEALRIIADLYVHPTLDAGEIEKEKGVIAGEIDMYEDMPQHKVWDVFAELLYGDQPAGWNVAGTKATVAALSRADIAAYRSRRYRAPATVVVIAGGFDRESMVRAARRLFAPLHDGARGAMPKVKERQSEPAEKTFEKKSDQTHLVLGFRAFGARDPRKHALAVLADILGGGMSSRLWQTVREDMGAAYYVGAGADISADHGTLALSAGVHHGKTRDVVKAALAECKRLVDEPVPAAELARAKEHMIGNFFLSLETSDALGYYYGGQEIMGLPLRSPEEAAAKIKAVTAAEIRDVARTLFVEKSLNFAGVGPFGGERFGDILKL